MSEIIYNENIIGDFSKAKFLKSGWSDTDTSSKISNIELCQPVNDVICNRMRFREYCNQIGLKQPEYFVSDKFNKISDWLIKRNTFPKVLKFTINSSDCNNIYKLNGFRELPQFYDLMTKDNKGSVLVEEWVTGRARVEVTILNDRILHICQIGLTKSLEVKHAWRMYPLSLPDKLTKQIINIVEKLSNLLKIRDLPIRLSMIIGKDTITPISVNSGLNRLEYYPSWSEEFGIPSLFEENTSITNVKNGTRPKYLFRIHFFYKSLNQNLTETALKELNLQSFMKFASTADIAIVLLRDKDVTVLQKDYNQIKSMLESVAYSGE